jgi:uncharacterized membrane protein HdeD (DUF308 family)
MNIAIGIVLIALGVYVCVRPRVIATRIERFYTNNPLVGYAKSEQLQSRSGFVRVLGAVFIGLGVLAFVA